MQKIVQCSTKESPLEVWTSSHQRLKTMPDLREGPMNIPASSPTPPTSSHQPQQQKVMETKNLLLKGTKCFEPTLILKIRGLENAHTLNVLF